MDYWGARFKFGFQVSLLDLLDRNLALVGSEMFAGHKPPSIRPCSMTKLLGPLVQGGALPTGAPGTQYSFLVW